MWPPDQRYPTRFGASQKCEFWSPTPDLRNQNPQRRNWIVTSTPPFPGSSGFTLSFEKHRAGGTGWSEPESRGERGQGSKASPARAWSEKRRRRSAGPPAEGHARGLGTPVPTWGRTGIASQAQSGTRMHGQDYRRNSGTGRRLPAWGRRAPLARRCVKVAGRGAAPAEDGVPREQPSHSSRFPCETKRPKLAALSSQGGNR